MKKIRIIKKLATVLAVTLALSACGNDEVADSATSVAQEKKTIVMGFGPSTYSEQFKNSIQPLLEAQGYTVEPKIFSQNAMINRSMQDGEIHASVFQSTAAMKDTNRLINMNMVKLADIASAPQSLRSERHDSLDDVKDGMTITVPNDSVNAERAARILEKLGWVKVREGVNPIQFTVKDLSPGQYDLNIKEIDPAQALRTLSDVDFSIVNGNYVVNLGMSIADGLVVEETPADHVVIVTIEGENINTQWAKDLKQAYESKEFENYIKNEPLYDGFIYPKHWDN